MDRGRIIHDLTILYLSLYDNPQTEKQKLEGEFVGRYYNTRDRIKCAMPDLPEKEK